MADELPRLLEGRDPYPEAKAGRGVLPPPGPYITKYAMQSVVRALNEPIEVIEIAEAEEKLEDVKAALVLAKETLPAKIDDLEEA